MQIGTTMHQLWSELHHKDIEISILRSNTVNRHSLWRNLGQLCTKSLEDKTWIAAYTHILSWKSTYCCRSSFMTWPPRDPGSRVGILVRFEMVRPRYRSWTMMHRRGRMIQQMIKCAYTKLTLQRIWLQLSPFVTHWVKQNCSSYWFTKLGW